MTFIEACLYRRKEEQLYVCKLINNDDYLISNHIQMKDKWIHFLCTMHSNLLILAMQL